MVLDHFLHFVLPDHFKQNGIVKVDQKSKFGHILNAASTSEGKNIETFLVDSSGLGGFGKTLEGCQRESGGRRRINKSPGTWSAGYNKDPPIKEEICPVIDNISDTATKG